MTHAVRNYIEQIASIDPGGLHTLLLEKGRVYTRVIELPPELAQHLGEAKNCYENAGAAILFDPRLSETYHYVEGFASGSVWPVRHAWIGDDDGNAYDVTWRTDDTCGFCNGAGVRSPDDHSDCDYCDGSPDIGCEAEETCFWCKGTKVTDTNPDPNGCEYFGMPFDYDTLRTAIRSKMTWGVLDWEGLAR